MDDADMEMTTRVPDNTSAQRATGAPVSSSADRAAMDPSALSHHLRICVSDVVDPEIPAVSVVDMGMIGDISIDTNGHVMVEILPTFSGCPALEIIAADVRARLEREPGVGAVSVRFVYDPPWTSDRITAAGRAKLTAFGIAPAGTHRTPLGRPLPMLAVTGIPCPHCGSAHTVRDNLFGPTPCRALYRCLACRNPFEAFKPV